MKNFSCKGEITSLHLYHCIFYLLYIIHLSIEKRIADLSQKIISLFRSHVSWRLSGFSAMARRKVTFPIFQRQSSISGSLEDERRKMVTTTMARMSQELRERSSPLASTRTRDVVYVDIYTCIYTCVYNFIVSTARPRKRSGARATILSNWFREFSVKRFRKVAGQTRKSKKLTHTRAAKVRVGNDFNYLVELSPLITGRTRNGCVLLLFKAIAKLSPSLRRVDTANFHYASLSP